MKRRWHRYCWIRQAWIAETRVARVGQCRLQSAGGTLLVDNGREGSRNRVVEKRRKEEKKEKKAKACGILRHRCKYP